jgi:hypothetical protein
MPTLFNKVAETISKTAFGVAAFIPASNAWTQDVQQAQNRGDRTASSPSDQRNPTQALSDLKAPSRDGLGIPVPERIAKAAEAKAIPLSAIELKGEQWVGCVEDLCIGLGKATTEELEALRKTKSIEGLRPGQRVYISGYTFADHIIDPKNALSYELEGVGLFALQPDGSVTFTPDPQSQAIVSTTPFATQEKQEPAADKAPAVQLIERDFSKEFRAQVEALIEKELDTTFVIDFSVPSLCAPCRQLRGALDTLKATLPPDRKVTIIINNSDSFEESQQVTGYGTVPTITIVPRLPAKEIEAVEKGETESTGKSYRPFLGRTRRLGYVFQGAPSAKGLTAAIDRAEARSDQGLDSPWGGLKSATADILRLAR